MALLVSALVVVGVFYVMEIGPQAGPRSSAARLRAGGDPLPLKLPSLSPILAPPRPGACAEPSAFQDAAAANGTSLLTAQWSIAGRPETGWRVYAPLAAKEVGTDCGAGEAGFAQALARWQAAHGLPADGRADADTLRAMDLIWLRRRPFVAATREGACPPPPPEDQLAPLRPDESYSGKTIRLHQRALAAYRRLVATARADLPLLARDPRTLTVFSGFRGPEEEKARCAQGAPCNTVTKARCSAHRTGMALDLFLGTPPGSAPDDTSDASRARLVQSPLYRWLVAHAAGFGFVPYPFEPWHWEFAGKACGVQGSSCGGEG